MFENLGERLQNVVHKVKGYGKITEDNISEMMREIRLALLEADVNYQVVKEFVANVKEKALGEEVQKSIKPGDLFVKIVQDELTELLGGESAPLNMNGNPAILMLVGLQGSGKTTTIGKLANMLRKKNHKKPLLVACDVYRPAAIDQLKQIGKQLNIEVYEEGKNDPVEICRNALLYAKENGYDYVLIDTAGRLHIDDDMMAELQEIKENVTVHQTVLVVDAMTGQDAVNVAKMFDEKVGIDGVILTKLDGDTRGGAALSIRAVTGRPILYIGMGEKLSDLEQFYPDRMASRILGMGDILSLIEKAELEVDEQKAKELSQKLKKAEFDYNDFLDQMRQIKKMGGMSSIMNMMPGMPQMKGNPEIDESAMDRVEAIILSMTAQERANPAILNPSRKQRIARGAGVDISEVNRIVKQFDQMKKMMKQLPGMMGGKGRGGLGGMLGKFKMPF